MEREGKTIAIGVIINPIAGLGGRVGLKGSDGPDVVEKALALGAQPEAAQRAANALAELEEIKESLIVHTYSGDMGEHLLTSMGFTVSLAGTPAAGRTTAQDTMEAAQKLRDAGVALILFAGGDGTARNICQAIGEDVPVIGIPAGVKIHSAVYATNARNAGLAVKEYLQGLEAEVALAEVMDIDEDMFRQGRLSARLYGYMKVPVSGSHMQHTKSSSVSEHDELMGVVGHVITKMEEKTRYIIGPGTTTRAITDELGLSGTLLGVDVVENSRLLAADVTENQLWELVKDPEVPVKIIVTIIGGQGNLFGRGNQQISPRILRRVGKKNIIVTATASKLNALYQAPLVVDTGDLALDKELSGYIEVVKGFAHTVIYPVTN
ncbi:ATP-NAD kinase family protein [Anoxynatronum buryatiense]|uniref:Predicted polyphosphate-or ATP-dependent NAD kinase n=1 Tax=Anoxynatronum buryatiense TaxID=489973 RepID=A0AA45WYC9_9CLOT|nr:ATP-NAD kinase family protein [Anoxynatronum buryatiense]SMP68466.1 Predicted polyphosphate-or ATP-dependent NAD kinase [Anoxynatronum buryatiense]